MRQSENGLKKKKENKENEKCICFFLLWKLLDPKPLRTNDQSLSQIIMYISQ